MIGLLVSRLLMVMVVLAVGGGLRLVGSWRGDCKFNIGNRLSIGCVATFGFKLCDSSEPFKVKWRINV